MNFQMFSLFGQERAPISRPFKRTFDIEIYRSMCASLVIAPISPAYFEHLISLYFLHVLKGGARLPSAKQWHTDFRSYALMLVACRKFCRTAFTRLCLRFAILKGCSSNCVPRVAAQL